MYPTTFFLNPCIVLHISLLTFLFLFSYFSFLLSCFIDVSLAYKYELLQNIGHVNFDRQVMITGVKMRMSMAHLLLCYLMNSYIWKV